MVSCIITTKNEESVIENLLSSLIAQSYKNFEIILVDNDSDDNTCKIADKYKVKIYKKGPERSIQRNFGVSKAKGNYVLILDADMSLTKNVLKESVGVLSENPNMAGLVIPEKSYGKGFWVKFKIFEREFYLRDDSIEAARFFKKDIFIKYKGYDSSMTGPEDYDLPLRMKKDGFKIGRIKSYILHNEKNFSPIGSAKKKFYYASHGLNYLKKHPYNALKQGNLFFRPVFFKKWKKIISHPYLSLGMMIVKFIEGLGVLSGVVYSVIIVFIKKFYVKSNFK